MDYIGLTKLYYKDSSLILLYNILFILGLKVNLLSIRYLY